MWQVVYWQLNRRLKQLYNFRITDNRRTSMTENYWWRTDDGCALCQHQRTNWYILIDQTDVLSVELTANYGKANIGNLNESVVLFKCVKWFEYKKYIKIWRWDWVYLGWKWNVYFCLFRETRMKILFGFGCVSKKSSLFWVYESVKAQNWSWL